MSIGPVGLRDLTYNRTLNFQGEERRTKVERIFILRKENVDMDFEFH